MRSMTDVIGGNMFTLGNIIILCLVGVIVLGAIISTGVSDLDIAPKVVFIIIEIIAMIGLVIGCAAYNTHTESGKRSVKSWKSETGGGIDRTVTVYDIEGEEVAKYSGRFDIEESSQEGVVKIKFDCNGKRHIIYAQTGTVLIDEN